MHNNAIQQYHNPAHFQIIDAVPSDIKGKICAELFLRAAHHLAMFFSTCQSANGPWRRAFLNANKENIKAYLDITTRMGAHAAQTLFARLFGMEPLPESILDLLPKQKSMSKVARCLFNYGEPSSSPLPARFFCKQLYISSPGNHAFTDIAARSQLVSSLVLQACDSITDADLLSFLTHTPRLTELFIKQCPQITLDTIPDQHQYGTVTDVTVEGDDERKNAISLDRLPTLFPQLTTLALSHIPGSTIDAHIDPLAKNCRHLTHLDVAHCPISQTAFHTLTTQCPLQFINLKSCKNITPQAVLEAFTNAPTLIGCKMTNCMPADQKRMLEAYVERLDADALADLARAFATLCFEHNDIFEMLTTRAETIQGTFSPQAATKMHLASVAFCLWTQSLFNKDVEEEKQLKAQEGPEHVAENKKKAQAIITAFLIAAAVTSALDTAKQNTNNE